MIGAIVIILLSMQMILLASAADNVSPSGPKPDVNPYVLIPLAAFLILVPFLLLFTNTFKSFKEFEKREQKLSEILATAENAKNKDFLEIYKLHIQTGPSGVDGVSRTTMAMTVTMIIGIAAFLTAFYNLNENGILKDIILTLTGALSSIIGFYFGGRSAGEAKTASTPAAGEPKPP
jgi:hypothetical protein